MSTETREAEKALRILLHETDEGKALLDLTNEMERREEYVRYRNVLKWRKHMYYWNGIQYLAESVSDHRWVTPEEILEQDPQSDIDPSLYAKVVNVYKAHGEILIGALTSGLPTVRFMPRDADNPQDIQTAKAASVAAELIQRQNKARIQLMRALFILYNQGMVAAYNDQKSDFKFGTIETPIYEIKDAFDRQHYCPQCGTDMGQEQWQHDPDLHPDLPQGPVMSTQTCPGCNQDVEPDYEDQPTKVKVQTGTTEEPKNREVIEVYGPLNAKIPLWVRSQGSTPYLILETEEPVELMKELYPEIEDLIVDIAYPESLERESRVPSTYKNDFPKGLCNVKRVWFRKWAFNYLTKDKNEIWEKLCEQFPDGSYCVIINGNILAEVVPDKLDDHWTLSENPLSEILQAEPIGAPMMPLQDIANELANLTLDTIEFGISEVFADSELLDFDSYPNQEVRPGQITPVTVKSGKTIQGGFYEVKPATLSREVELFADRQDKVQQFVMGSYPSVYGGPTDGGDTAKEYELSKTAALQRLSTTWMIVQAWYCDVMSKSTVNFMKNMREDEKFVKSKGTGFMNVWVRRADMQGQIGEADPEVNETFPISWAQKRDVILNMIQMKDPAIMTVVTHPENAGLIASIIGVPELYIPGDDDRNKQLYEISLLIQGEPQQGDQGQLLSTVEVTPDLDKHEIEIQVCDAWLKSEVGIDMKENNPGAYMNVLQHRREHQMAETQMQVPPPSSNPQLPDVGEVQHQPITA